MTTGSSISVVVGLYEMYDSPTTSRLDAKVTASQTARAFKVEVSTEKSKVLNNSTSDINTGISKNSQKLKDVTSFFYVPGSNPVKGWHLLSRNPNGDHLSNGSESYITQNEHKTND